MPVLSARERFILKRFLALKPQEKKEYNWQTKDFEKQNAFLNSKAKRIVAQCTRRAGKSYGAGKRMVKTALENDGVNILYIALTRDNAKRIMCKDVLSDILKNNGIRYTENKADLTYTFDNGSTIYIIGADNSEKEFHKLLGSKYKEVIIDEAAFFSQDLKYLVDEVIDPAVTDLDGTIVMISTPSINIYSYYYDVVSGKEKGWEIHKWTAYDNPVIKDKWDKKIALKIKNDPGVVNTPYFMRMFRNEWVIDRNLQCYKYNADTFITKMPELPKIAGAKWNYGLGVDLGWDDETAFSVSAWHKYSDILYIIFKYKKSEMDFVDVAEYIKVLEKYYGLFHYRVVDGANKQGVQTMINRHELDLIAAEKTAKYEHIELFNSEMGAGKIKVLADKKIDPENVREGEGITDALGKEWTHLVWDEEKKKKGIFEELPSCPNHLSDSVLYNWRHAFNHCSISVPAAELY